MAGQFSIKINSTTSNKSPSWFTRLLIDNKFVLSFALILSAILTAEQSTFTSLISPFLCTNLFGIYIYPKVLFFILGERRMVFAVSLLSHVILTWFCSLRFMRSSSSSVMPAKISLILIRLYFSTFNAFIVISIKITHRATKSGGYRTGGGV